MYFFTADEHYGHGNIIKWCKRPFANTGEMNTDMITRNNKVVGPNDVVIHAGDFCWSSNPDKAAEFIKQLNGNHIFLIGSHDRWMRQSTGNHKHIWEKRIDGQVIVVCHYALRVWPRSHFGSWNLYGHSHGTLSSQGKQYDVGVDCNNFYPVSFEEIKIIMSSKPNNLNFIKEG